MKALTNRALKEARDLAAKYPGKRGSEIIESLCAEIERLRSKTQHSDGEFTEDSIMFFGKEHKGKPLHRVPESFMRWWFGQQNREALKIDSDFKKFPEKAIALKKLKLYDYLAQRFNGQTD